MASREPMLKLIDHEKSARAIGSIAEANAFAGKIQKLLSENNLSMADFMPAQPQVHRSEYTPVPKRNRTPKWHNGPATPEQVRTIQKLYRMHVPAALTKGKASELIRAFFSAQQASAQEARHYDYQGD
jgi:hypothetical protein